MTARWFFHTADNGDVFLQARYHNIGPDIGWLDRILAKLLRRLGAAD
jgi:hypothetical protein